MKNTPCTIRTPVEDLSPYQISDVWVQLFIGYQIQTGRKKTICTTTMLLCISHNIAYCPLLSLSCSMCSAPAILILLIVGN